MAFRDNHIASKCYLAQWVGDDGRLRAVTPPSLVSVPKRPAKVGFRPNFWGRDPRVRQVIEEQLNRIEDPAAHALRRLPDSWPLKTGGQDWLSLLGLISIHMRRNPFAQQHMHRIEQNVIARNLRDYERIWPGDQIEDFLARVSSDGFRVQSLLDRLNLPTSVLGSMHALLLEFRDHLLATSDQPVTMMPLLAPGHRPPSSRFRGRFWNARRSASRSDRDTC